MWHAKIILYKISSQAPLRKFKYFKAHTVSWNGKSWCVFLFIVAAYREVDR